KQAEVSQLLRTRAYSLSMAPRRWFHQLSPS
ncbi:unnamed protein product, partial [Rotaria sp. Silwood1]